MLLAWLGLAGLVVLVRLVGISWYPLVHPDEGYWACGSRNLVLYGDAIMDGRLHPFLSPGMFVPLSGWFVLVPPSLTTARAFSAFAGMAACALLGLLARRELPGKAWLVVLLFGLSSLAVLPQRMILLEALQTFWMVVAAFCWLAPRPRPIAAGLTYGMALLVKSNAIYLLPAFLLTLPVEEGRPRWRIAARLLTATAVMAGGVYLTVWGIYPAKFQAAFHYELDGGRFIEEGVLFHVGRFGLHSSRAPATLTELLRTDGLLVALAALGLWGCRSAGRADRFFACWAVLGAVFTFGQIYPEFRYLATLAPAVAWLAVRTLARGLDHGSWRVAAVCVLVVFALLQLARFGAGVWRAGNADYWRVEAWMRDSAATSDRVLAAPSLNLSLAQQGHDFFRALFPYDAPRRPLGEVCRQLEIKWIIVDPEWREYEVDDDIRFLAENCVRMTTVGETVVFRVNKAMN